VGRTTALSNGNYVVRSLWNGGRGAATWGSGTAGVSGTISAANSLIGSSAGDQVGNVGGITALSNGNYVVGSPNWNGGRGAATWGIGAFGTSGVVSASNSLVGSLSNDFVGWNVSPLTNGNYVVLSQFWNGHRGAATLGIDGIVTGAISAGNSLVGSVANDSVGSDVVPLTNGNYVVLSQYWNGNRGAATWGHGGAPLHATVSSDNSLVGSLPNDRVGFSVLGLSNGNYLVGSKYATLQRAATWASGTTGLTLDESATITPQNSLIGLEDSIAPVTVVEDPGHQAFLAAFPTEAGGRVTSGFADPNLLTYSRSQAQTITITPAVLTRTLNNGGAVILQASNDITVNSPITVSIGGGGALTLQAGRSIFINANITNNNVSSLTLIANDRLVNGVVDSQRDPGNAVISMAVGTSLNLWPLGVLTVEMRDGAGKTNSASGAITLQTVTAGTVIVTNNGLTAGSDVVLAGPVTSSGGGQSYTNPNGTTIVAGSLFTFGTLSFLNSVTLNAGQTVSAGTVNFAGSGTQILQSGSGASFSNLVHNGSGTLRLSSAVTVTGGFSNTNPLGTFDASNQTLSVGGDWTWSAGLFLFAGSNVNLNGSAQALTSGGQTFNHLTHNGSGTLTLLDSLTLAGNLTNQAGGLNASNRTVTVGGNWSWSGGTFTATGSMLLFNGSASQALASGGQSFNQLLHTGTGTLLLADSLTVFGSFSNTAGTFDANAQAVIVVGLTTIDNGTQYLGSTGNQSFGGGLSMPAGGSLSGTSLTLGGGVSAGEDGSGNPATITGNLSLDGASRTFTIAAGVGPTQLLISSVISGSSGVGLTKAGAGTLRLQADNTYTGPTTIQAGLLVVDGMQAGSDVTLSGGSLAGQGTVGAVTASGGTLSPGDPEATGVLTSLGNVALASSATFSVRLNDTTAGAGYDQFNVTGAVDLNSGAGAGSTLAVSVGFASQVGDTFTILTAGGGITGTFQGLDEGAIFTVGGMNFQITYQGAGGMAVVLTHVA
jgi:autotransporter-associated beta strand protein